MTEVVPETPAPFKRPRVPMLVAGVLGSMLLPWLGLRSFEGLRPPVVTFDPVAVQQLLDGATPLEEPGARVLRIGEVQPPVSSTALWPETTVLTVRRRDAAPDDDALRMMLHAPPRGGEALARALFLHGRDPIRRLIARQPLAPDGNVDEEALLAQVQRLLGPAAVQRVERRPDREEPESAMPVASWTWPPEQPAGPRKGVLVDTMNGADRRQIQLWDMGRDDWPMNFQMMALTLAPFPTHQQVQGWRRLEIAGEAGYGLWLTDGRLIVGVVTDGHHRPEEALLDLPFVTSLGSRSPLAGIYGLYDERPTSVLLSAIALFLMVWILGVLRATSWAGERPPARGTERADIAALREALLDMNGRFTVHPGQGDLLEFGWSLEDPEVQRTAGAVEGMMGQTHRLIVELDERSGTVRGQERTVRVLWGRGDIDGELRAQELSSTPSGVDFIDRTGGWRSEDSADEPASVLCLAPAALRGAVSRVTLEAGWTYRPVLSFRRWISG